MNNKFFLIFIYAIIFSNLIGCSNKLNENNNNSKLNPIDQNMVESVEIMEKNNYDIINYQITFDNYIQNISTITAKNFLDDLDKKLVLSPYLFYAGLNVKVVTGNDIKGLTLEEIKEKYQNYSQEVIDKNFGNIEFFPVSISKVYTEDDNSLKYVFTKQSIKFDKWFDSDSTEITRYKKYTFINMDDNWVITNVEEVQDISLEEITDDNQTQDKIKEMTHFNDNLVEYIIEYNLNKE